MAKGKDVCAAHTLCVCVMNEIRSPKVSVNGNEPKCERKVALQPSDGNTKKNIRSPLTIIIVTIAIWVTCTRATNFGYVFFTRSLCLCSRQHPSFRAAAVACVPIEFYLHFISWKTHQTPRWIQPALSRLMIASEMKVNNKYEGDECRARWQTWREWLPNVFDDVRARWNIEITFISSKQFLFTQRV